MSGLTMLSRVAGLVRDKACSYFLGVGTEWSAFWMGFQFPNLFRRVFGEGALTAVFVPAYTEVRQKQGQGAANRLASATLTWMTVVLLAVTMMGEAILIPVALRESVAPTNRLAALMIAIMLPYAVCVCLVAIMGAIATVHERFIAQSLSPIILNFCMAGAAGLTVWVMSTAYPLSHRIFWVAFAVLFAGVVQVFMMLPTLRKSGVMIRPTLDYKTSGLSLVIRPLLPIVLGYSAVQFNVFIDTQIAWWFSPDGHNGSPFIQFFQWTLHTPLEAGAVGKLSIAQRIYLLPVGIFGVAMATAIFPPMARAATDNNMLELKRLLIVGLRKTLFLSIPASFGMILLAKPLITLIFLGGHVTSGDVDRAYWAAIFFCMGIWAFEAQMIIVRAFYVLKDTRTPTVVAFCMIAFNVCLNLLLIWPLREGGIALATTLSAILQGVILLWCLRKRLGVLGLRSLGKNIAKSSLATAVMVAAGLAIGYLPLPWSEVTLSTEERWLAACIKMPSLLIVCGAIYLGLAHWMRMPEVHDVPFVGRRIFRKRPEAEAREEGQAGG